MIMAMEQCCCFSLRTGCIFIAVFCAIENLTFCITIAVRYHTIEDEIEDAVENKVMSAFLIYLTVLTGSMFLFNIAFLIGTLFEWKHIVLGWVIVYSLMLAMRSVLFLATGVLCIMVPTCNTTLGIVILTEGYIPMALHSFFGMVVFGYFRFLEPLVREMPVFTVSTRGESLKRGSPKVASQKLSPKLKVAFLKLNAKEAANKPDPKETASISTPKEGTSKPNPKEGASKSNPKEDASKPNPKEAASKPNLKETASKSNPKEGVSKPNPKETASKPNPKT